MSRMSCIYKCARKRENLCERMIIRVKALRRAHYFVAAPAAATVIPKWSEEHNGTRIRNVMVLSAGGVRQPARRGAAVRWRRVATQKPGLRAATRTRNRHPFRHCMRGRRAGSALARQRWSAEASGGAAGCDVASYDCHVARRTRPTIPKTRPPNHQRPSQAGPQSPIRTRNSNPGPQRRRIRVGPGRRSRQLWTEYGPAGRKEVARQSESLAIPNRLAFLRIPVLRRPARTHEGCVRAAGPGRNQLIKSRVPVRKRGERASSGRAASQRP